jgi:xanthine dehydrogenase accessory factor
MQGTQLDVLYGIRNSLLDGFRVTLVSVAQTWGASPRPVGALLAINSDGHIYGSVSGGCVEDDLISKLTDNPVNAPRIQLYGETNAERQRLGLPCGGTMKLILESMTDLAEVDALIEAINSRQIISRRVDLITGEVSSQVTTAQATSELITKDETAAEWINIFGPRHQLIVIGAGQTSEYLASMALALEYNIHIIDPRPEYHQHWPIAGVQLHTQYPDDAIVKIGIDSRTAVVALTHDLKLDDLALIAALKSDAFYIGALGSTKTTDNRKQRLREHFGFSEDDLKKLHGPVGFKIGSKTPPEIALSVLAEITAVKNKTI